MSATFIPSELAVSCVLSHEIWWSPYSTLIKRKASSAHDLNQLVSWL